MNATIRVMPIVRNLTAIAAERALGHEWEEHPMFGIEVDGDAWAAKYQEQITQLQTALDEIGKPHAAALDEDEAINRAPASFEEAHHRLKGVVDWLIEQGFKVLSYSAGGEGFPVVHIAYSEAARRVLRMTGAGSRTDAGGNTFTRFSARRNGVRVWWEREESRFWLRNQTGGLL